MRTSKKPAIKSPHRSLPGHGFRQHWYGSALVLAFITPVTAYAGDVEAVEPGKSERVTKQNPELQNMLALHDQYTSGQTPDSITAVAAQIVAATPDSQPIRFGTSSDGKDYLLPAEEIVGFNFLLNRFNYLFIDKQVYGTTLQSVRDNLHNKWIVDTDPFAVNQFMHPYQGSVYFGLARLAGLDYWESMGYTFGGSLLWEIAGETGAPSINDLITTGFGGSFLGEPLFRMANLLLERGGKHPSVWREIGAAAISPSLGFTRLAYGDRFRNVFDSHNPATYTYVRLGWNKIDSLFDPTVSQNVKRNAATLDYHMSYGLPGKDGYTYTRPFDYFDFEFTATTANMFENIMSRGLLVGKDYAVGENYRGVWGLYGSYDYISPQVFRVSSTAVSLGTTGQWWLSKNVALQGTALAGVGYGAAGTIHGSGERNYHYGATPQALLALRMLFGEAVNFDLTARSYYVSDVASTENRGTERIFRGDAAFTVRVHGPHSITLKYNASRRDASYPDLANTHQTVKTISLLYTYLFDDTRFGAVDWRDTPRIEQ